MSHTFQDVAYNARLYNSPSRHCGKKAMNKRFHALKLVTSLHFHVQTRRGHQRLWRLIHEIFSDFVTKGRSERFALGETSE